MDKQRKNIAQKIFVIGQEQWQTLASFNQSGRSSMSKFAHQHQSLLVLLDAIREGFLDNEAGFVPLPPPAKPRELNGPITYPADAMPLTALRRDAI